MQSDILLQTLTDQAHNALGQVDEFKKLDTATLTWRENPTSWNVLECLQHLNLYGDFYLPAMDAKIKASHTKPEREFKPGLLGDYFAKSMLPGQKMKKMKTFADKNLPTKRASGTPENVRKRQPQQSKSPNVDLKVDTTETRRHF
jgi:hypothetical protein